MREARRQTRWVWALVLWLSVLVAATASAQSTGGSVGSSSWGGSGGGSSSSSSSSSSWSGSSSSSYDGAASNSYEPPYLVQLVISIAFLVGLYWLFRLLLRNSGPLKIDVAMVQLAIDARSRRFVQKTLAELASRGDTRSDAGRAQLLATACEALRSARLAWIYAGTRSFDPMPAPHARVELTRLAHDARAGFETELVRAEGGRTATTAAPALAPQEHEGDGVVLVTVLAASRSTLRDVRGTSEDEIDALLRQLSALPAAQLVAVEIVWSPAAESDRMSTAELEAKYPALARLTTATGRVFCAYCGGPHAAELSKCPHCGAMATAEHANG